jgi:cyclohexa-1,5-dienecarbonyl-CoA hydratase
MDQEKKQFVSHQIQSSVATITINHPPVNIVHMPTLKQLEATLIELSQDENVRVLVLRAEGKMFSAGADVEDHTADKVGKMIPLFNRTCRFLANFPCPTLAVVHGHALGGGCELVLCCDFAVMAAGAKIGQPEIQLASFAPVAVMRLPHMVGYRAAVDILLTGRMILAEEAQKIGLVNAVVPADQLEQWVDEKIGQLLSLSRVALTITKSALRTCFGNWDASVEELEKLYLDELMKTNDAHEGLAAFIEKRPAVWKHK